MGRGLLILHFAWILLVFLSGIAFGQSQKLTAGELFKLAQNEAAVRNLPSALYLAKQAIVLEPRNAEARLFLGDLFAADGHTDSARVQYNRILKDNPADSRAIDANYNLEFTNENYGFALHFAEVGLKYYPGSAEYAAKRDAALKALGRPTQSAALTTNPATSDLALQSPDRSVPAKPVQSTPEASNNVNESQRSTTSPSASSAPTETLTSDDLFQLARKEVYDRNNYPKGISYLKKALLLSPDYADLRVFLGRIYTWSNKIDSARREFNRVLSHDPTNTDAVSAMFDLEYWNENYGFALVIAEKGLKIDRNSEDFTIKKAKSLNALKKSSEAASTLADYVKQRPGSQAASALLKTIEGEIRLREAESSKADLAQSQTPKAPALSPAVSFTSGNLTPPVVNIPQAPTVTTIPESPVAVPVINSKPATASELFDLARKAAFDKKSYPEAISLSKQSLALSDDNDVRLFLGRLYTWSDFADSARAEFYSVLFKNPRNADALAASYDLELWNDRPKVALEYAETGLRFYPESEDFTVKKAKALVNMKRYGAAIKIAKTYLLRFPESGPVLALERSIKEEFPQNSVGVGHSTVYFDKRFDQPWFLSSVSYGRQTRLGSVTLNVNHANRFKTSGLEGEVEAYPRIAKRLYAYVGGGMSGSSIFPNHRLGVSLYTSLPHSFEAEAGLRYLQFSDATIFYVFGLGRYIGNNFYGLRSYITPSNVRSSVSFNLSTRFYLGQDRYDSFGIAIGTGTSPDDRARRIDINNTLNSIKAGFDYSATVIKRTALSLGISWSNEEYLTDTFGNQYTFSASLSHRF